MKKKQKNKRYAIECKININLWEMRWFGSVRSSGSNIS